MDDPLIRLAVMIISIAAMVDKMDGARLSVSSWRFSSSVFKAIEDLVCIPSSMTWGAEICA